MDTYRTTQKIVSFAEVRSNNAQILWDITMINLQTRVAKKQDSCKLRSTSSFIHSTTI